VKERWLISTVGAIGGWGPLAAVAGGAGVGRGLVERERERERETSVVAGRASEGGREPAPVAW